MKSILAIFFLFISSCIYGSTAIVQIKELCGDKVLHSFEQRFEGETTVSQLSLSSFDENSIDYLGAEQGINSLLGTPTGMDALEVLSDSQMRAYGWCFRVDGYLSHEMMHQTFVEDDTVITWYYGFTFYDSGEWSGICTPAHTVPTCHKL